MLKTLPLIFFFMLAMVSPTHAQTAHWAATPPTIDGNDNDPAWANGKWYPIDHSLLGEATDPADFSGRYKVVWHGTELFVLAELSDDVLIDTTADPFKRYWEDDTLELFIDADASGGDHHRNHNAFAYHFALDNRVIDIGTDGAPIDLTHHTKSAWRRSSRIQNGLIWEVSINVYDSDYIEDASNKPVALSAEMELGFMVAYCDADSAAGREHFYNSVDVAPVDGDRNRGYLTADVFGRLKLIRQAR